MKFNFYFVSLPIKGILLLFICVPFICAAGDFSTGIGYIKPGDYRVDNEINPLPLGISLLPIIAYRGERLNVLGPNISYKLIKGAIAFDLRLNAAGDRYKAYEVKQKGGTLNTGFLLRIFFLSLQHGVDFFNVYQGQTSNIFLSKPFFLSKKLMIIPRIGKEYLSSQYTNFYYGVSSEETGFFKEYEMKSAANDFYNVSVNYILSKNQSLNLSYSYKRFDQVIAESPTISENGFSTLALFWNFGL